MPEQRFTAEQVDTLRRIAWAADRGERPWDWTASQAEGKAGYPQQVLRVGDAVLIAECYDAPDERACTAEYIAAFDPPTVLRLLDEVVPHG